MFSSFECTKAYRALFICTFKAWGGFYGGDVLLIRLVGLAFALALALGSLVIECTNSKAFVGTLNVRLLDMVNFFHLSHQMRVVASILHKESDCRRRGIC
jgi:hypothetical protein